MRVEGMWKGIIEAGGAKIIAMALSMVSLALTARWLGPEGRGNIAAVTTWISLISTIGFLSLGQVAMHRATALRGTPWLGSTMGSLGLITLIAAFIGWLVIFGMYFFSKGKIFGGAAPALLVIGCLSLPFYIWENYGSSLLIAVDKLAIYNTAQIVGRAVTLFGVMVAIPLLSLGTKGGLAAIICGQVIVASMGMKALVNLSETRIRPEKETLKALLNGGLKLHFNAIGTLLFASAEILIIQYYRGPSETGHYQFALQLIGILSILPQAASMVIYGKVTNAGPDSVWNANKKIIWSFSGLMIGAALISAVAAPFAIPFVAGKAFKPAVIVFQFMLLTLFGKTLSTLMAPQWIGRGLFMQTSTITFLIGIINLGGCLLMVPKYGMYGALAASILTQAVSFLINLGMVIWIEAKAGSVERKLKEEYESAAFRGI